jgi:predicted ATPase
MRILISDSLNQLLMIKEKPYLREVSLQIDSIPSFDKYPFSIPALKNLDSLEFHEDVTFLVGENGSGKSTLLEAIALRLGFGIEGGTKNVQVKTHNNASVLQDYIKLTKSFKKPQDHYFLRAESFYNVATYMEDVKYLQEYGGKSLHNQSHGESFMATLLNKLKGSGLYLFDEPEAALSPTRQLAAIAAIDQLVKKNSQFIIATHSPILMAYPNATIYLLNSNGIQKINYEESEHYIVTKRFLNDYQGMIEMVTNIENPR